MGELAAHRDQLFKVFGKGLHECLHRPRIGFDAEPMELGTHERRQVAGLDCWAQHFDGSSGHRADRVEKSLAALTSAVTNDEGRVGVGNLEVCLRVGDERVSGFFGAHDANEPGLAKERGACERHEHA